MLKWCAYCQEFMGEIPPFHTFELTHAMCPLCSKKGLEISDGEFKLALKLRSIQGQLMSAGKAGNIDRAADIVEMALDSGVRPVDILMGLVTPALYQIGEQWSQNQISVEDEHRFTAFCEKIYNLVEVRSKLKTNLAFDNVQVLVMNVPGNIHSLGIRMLALWLIEKGLNAVALEPDLKHGPSPTLEELGELITRHQPKFLMLSVAIPEQRREAVRIVRFVESLPERDRPLILVGGYAVKMGRIAKIPGADLVADLANVQALLA